MNNYFFYAGAVALSLTGILACFEKLGSKPNPLFSSNTLYLTVISVFLIINKLSYFNIGMTNIDESVMLSAGRTFGHHPWPWLSVDPSTSGPINLLPATLLIKIFDNASYGELRILYVIAFQIPTLVIFFLTANKIAGPFTARLAIMPLTLCFAFFFYDDHMHASSEQIPMLFTAIGMSTIFGITYGYIKKWQLALTGAVCALAPFAKLQAGPLLFFISFICFVLIYPKKRPWKDAVWLTIGFSVTNVAIILFINSYDGIYDFFQSYIRSNLNYVTNHYSQKSIYTFIYCSTAGLLPLILFFLLIVLLSAHRVGSIRRIPKADLLHLVIFVLILATAIYCVVKPGRFYFHYALLLVVPIYGCFLWIILRVANFNRSVVPYFSACTGLLLFVLVINKTYGTFVTWTPYQVPSVNTLNFLISKGSSTDRLAAWGWGSPYIHGAKLLMGTRDVHYAFQTGYTGTIGDYYKARFLADLKQNRPKWFLDISGPGEFGGSEANKLRNFPAIHDFVIKNYAVVLNDKTSVLYHSKSR